VDFNDKEKLKRLIVNQIADLEKQINLSEESSQTVELDQTLAGRVSRIDAIQQQKMAESSNLRDKKLVIDLKTALEKLPNDDYGICQECDEPISIARLQIKPESIYCISCQQSLFG